MGERDDEIRLVLKIKAQNHPELFEHLSSIAQGGRNERVRTLAMIGLEALSSGVAAPNKTSQKAPKKSSENGPQSSSGKESVQGQNEPSHSHAETQNRQSSADKLTDKDIEKRRNTASQLKQQF